MKTGTNLSARQQALKARHKLSNRQFQQMLEMLADLTPDERASLEEPDFITEDEADIIVSNRRINEPDRPFPLKSSLPKWLRSSPQTHRVNGWKVELRHPPRREFRQLEDGPKRAAEELLQDPAEQVPRSSRQSSCAAHTYRARFHHDRYRMVYQVSKSAEAHPRGAHPCSSCSLQRHEALRPRHYSALRPHVRSLLP